MSTPKKQTVKLPLTNIYAYGDYTAQLHVGSEESPVNLIIDSGSSTLVLDHEVYRASQDKHLTATTWAQTVTYGVGGWDGPVIKTRVKVKEQDKVITLKQCPIAIISSDEQEKTFALTQGILGLAYRHLNKSYDLKEYLETHKIKPALTYPWPFARPDCLEMDGNKFDSDELKPFKKFIAQYPKHEVLPYFTRMEELGLTANKFAFYSKRSSVHVMNEDAEEQELKADPLNQGYLILGGGEEHIDLYQGEFQTIEVIDNCYYNVRLKAMQVADHPPIEARLIDDKYKHNYFTNAIIDTGVSGMALTNDLYQYMLNAFHAISEEFTELLKPFKDISFLNEGIDAAKLELEKWPDLHFFFQNGEQQTRWTCTPSDYWQVNSPTPGKAVFKIIDKLAKWPNQNLMGLPLLNSYYVVFDREENEKGVIKFAAQRS